MLPSTQALISTFFSVAPSLQLAHRIRDRLGADADAVFAGKKPVVATCGSGMTAAVIWLALNRLGVDATIYDESWTGYAGRPESEIAKGK